MNNPGFYKFADNDILYAPTLVTGPEYTLSALDDDLYVYPVDGWYWFDDETVAKNFFGVT